MIAFSCPQCGLKLQVKPEFAGRSTKCPTCKQPLIVPAVPGRNDAPTRVTNCSPADLRQLADTNVLLERPGERSLRDVLARRSAQGERYVIDGEIGRGGMGAVLRAVDCDVHREVALKYVLGPIDRRRQLRFIEEAQITGQLEHPNIVPVHELGLDAEQHLFIAMKMVKGRSLAQVLDELRKSPRLTEKEYPLSRLLTVLVSVCHALEYAHSRGVVHRDLKPANIMLGDFGEVYVMDWGLAKVLRTSAATEAETAVTARPPLATLVTDRILDADMTQEGAVLGTAAYMPPEQASGRVQAIDARSDVYAIGAILYEMLTLKAPVDTTGGMQALLGRVIRGEIVVPEQRTPDRATAGKVPPELSAVAMKALATEPAARYQSVADFRSDIELFQEGHSVSAKEDTKRELFVKFVKRHRGFSAATAAALLVLTFVLTVSFSVNTAARVRAERSQAETLKAQAEKEERTRKAVPAMVASARLLVERRRFDDALKQVQAALEYDENHSAGRLLKAQLLLVQKDFVAARADLDRYLKDNAADAGVRQVRELCGRPWPEEPGNLLQIARLLDKLEAPTLAERLLHEYGVNTREAREELLKLYRKRIDAAWPGLGVRLTRDPSGVLKLNLGGFTQVTTLEPLEDMPLTWLSLTRCSEVPSLAPLKGMPLTTLNLAGCVRITDLRPLQGMTSLTNLNLHALKDCHDLTPLRGLKLTQLTLSATAVRDLSPLREMPLEKLILMQTHVQDLSPLQGKTLEQLDLRNCRDLKDLTSLKGTNVLNIYIDLRYVDKGPKGIGVLRSMDSLQTIRIGDGEGKQFPPAEFWKRYLAGEFDK